MPTITLTPGSSTPSIISLTYDAGASLGNIAFSAGGNYDDPFSYVIQTAGGTYYWATLGGDYSGSVEAIDPVGSPPTSAKKDGVIYDVRGLVLADFIQAGFNYVISDGSGGHNWCNSSGTEESPAVSASPIDTFSSTAYRVGEIFNYVDIIGGGGGT
jgi:hypothetical protein